MTPKQNSDSEARARVSCGPFEFEADAGWSRRPAGYAWTEVTAVATDSHDRVFVFVRGEVPVLVFDRTGTLLDSWGRGLFARPHGLTIGPDDRVYCVDDLDHTVRIFSPQGALLQTIGESGRPSFTGASSIDYRSIRHSGPPFHFPTNLAISPNGDLFVADGYGNARIHRFSADGRLLHSWGEPGAGPGQFHVPHGIAINGEGLIFVADRENNRIQIFENDGTFREQLTDVARPCQVAFDNSGNLLVAELGYRSGMWPGTFPPELDATGGRVSIFNSNLDLLGQMGGGTAPTTAGDFFAPHDICIDSKGTVYVAEVVYSAGGNRGLVSADCHSLQQFRPIAGETGRCVASQSLALSGASQ
jgi:DNA-binding beta-propeller fold protein YncE